MVVISGCALDLECENGLLWSACNGARRTRLALYRAPNVEVERVLDTTCKYVYVARAVPLWHQTDWRSAAVYLQKSDSDELYHVRLDERCGFNIVPKEAELFAAWSWGGPKNSASKIAVIAPPAYVEVISYKHATPYRYLLLDTDGSVHWLGEPSDVIAKHFHGDKNATRLCELKEWLEELA